MTTVLVVDDEPDLTWTIAAGLGVTGYDVLRAHSGVEALYWLESRAVDLAIIDVRMSGMDGFELCRHLRGHPRWSRIAVLFLTARSEMESKERGFGAGGDDYLTKPFDLDELRLRLAALLRRDASPSSTTLVPGDIALDIGSRQASVDGVLIPLTDGEAGVLRCLLQHTGEVLSSEQLLVEGLGYAPWAGNASTLRWYIKKLRAKLERDPDHPRRLHTIHGAGYTLDPA